MQVARYSYSITADVTSFTATARANLDDDVTIDSWTIDQDGNLVNTSNDVAG
jgi:hypothetical protein